MNLNRENLQASEPVNNTTLPILNDDRSRLAEDSGCVCNLRFNVMMLATFGKSVNNTGEQFF